MPSKYLIYVLLCCVVGVNCVCSNKKGGSEPPPPAPSGPDAEFWLTAGSSGPLLEKQATVSFGTTANSFLDVNIDTTTTMQSVDGFGYTMTGASAFLINQMNTAEKNALLNELFGNGTGSIGVSYLRVSIGASDLSQTVFSYDDMPTGQTDPTLTNFTLSKDTTDLIPVLKQVLTINPSIKILGSPWSPPVWMKDNGSSIGGGLLPQYYGVYAQYFVKYIQTMQAKGIPIDAITIQNEPQHGGNNPSLVMSAAQQAEFIKTNLGPAFQTAGITTKIIIWDHNCDNPNYPIAILNDAAARQYVNGSAFHLYGGDISALTTVHNAYPDKQLYFTEQWTGANGAFNGDLTWNFKNVVIGSMRNWSKVALQWNLASDPTYSLHTPGGCTECKGAITISGSTVTRNVAYYIIAQASKFIPTGSVRIGSGTIQNITTAAFKTPAGKKVVLAVNDATSAISFNIKFNGKWFKTTLGAGAAGTYIWP
jgi:glucosylceramidase